MSILTNNEFLLGIVACQTIFLIVLTGFVVWQYFTILSLKESMGKSLQELLKQYDHLVSRVKEHETILRFNASMAAIEDLFKKDPHRQDQGNKNKKGTVSSINSHLNLIKDKQNSDKGRGESEDNNNNDKSD